jgi:type I restriction enzyme, S subunit
MNSRSPLGTVPDNWVAARLKDTTLKIGSGATPRGGESVYLPFRQRVALIRSQNVFDRHFDETGLAFISDEHAEQLEAVAVQPGDLLLNITGDGVTFGRACLVPEHILPACVNQHVTIVRVNPELCAPGYLLAYLTHPSIKSYIEAFNSGGSRRAITKGHIESFEVPLPPIDEQRAIAHILGTLDDKIELNRRMNETLEAMARVLFKSWFVDFDPVRAPAEGRHPLGMDAKTATLFSSSFENSSLGEVPKGWTVGVINDFVTTVLGGDWGADVNENGTLLPALCIRGADIPNLQAAGTGKMPTRYLKSSSLERRSLQHGDIVVEISGGSPTQSTGRPVLITNPLLRRLNQPLVCSNFCRFIRLTSPVDAHFVYIWLRWLYSRDEFLQYENGTTGIKNLAFAIFCEKHELIIPPTSLLEAFDNRVSLYFELMQANGVESDTLATLRDTLLPKLLSGEVRVKDAEKFLEQAT